MATLQNKFQNSNWYKVCTDIGVYIYGGIWNQIFTVPNSETFEYIDDILFLWTHIKNKLGKFLVLD